MNCLNHPETQATAFCRECGKAMCVDCQCRTLGSIYCAEHAPATVTVTPELPSPSPVFAQEPPPPPPASAASTASFLKPDAAASPYTSELPPCQPDLHAHPVLALLLGFIPGVGAIYNGQYAKGLIHAVVFGLLVTVESRGAGGLEPLVGLMIAAWVFYMAFEAFHTATKRRKGIAVDEFSSLVDVRPVQGRFPTGAVFLIAVGFILLLDTTDLIDMEQISRYWPIGLIALGVYMLYNRTSGQHPAETPAPSGPAGSAPAEQGARQ